MTQRLAANNKPNLLLLNYSLAQLGVVNAFIVPKHFFVQEIIEKRNPLARNSSACWLGRL